MRPSLFEVRACLSHARRRSTTIRFIASPSTSAFPHQTSNPFCHTCRTNQTLQMNLLANYLPAPSVCDRVGASEWRLTATSFQDPMCQALLEGLPAYKASLDIRYPPVCATCLPSVQDDIQRKNHMARTTALGGWLRQTKGMIEAERRRVSNPDLRSTIHPKSGPPIITRPNLWVWRLQALLWALNLLASLYVSLEGAHHVFFEASRRSSDAYPLKSASGIFPRIFRPFNSFCVIGLRFTPALVLSAIPISWNPTLARTAVAKVPRRNVTAVGSETWQVSYAVCTPASFLTVFLPIELPTYAPVAASVQGVDLVSARLCSASVRGIGILCNRTSGVYSHTLRNRRNSPAKLVAQLGDLVDSGI